MGNWSDLQGGAIIRINSAYNALLPTEQQIADYILQNKEVISSGNIQELAENIGTSKASVTRFCQRLGYKGFKDFKVAFIRDLGIDLPDVHEGITKDDNIKTIVEKICRSNSQASLETVRILSPEELAKAVSVIVKAKRVYIFAEGPVAAVGIDLYHKLLRIGISCSFLQDRRMQSIQAALTDENDVVIALSYSGASKGIVKVLQLAKENNARTIVITNNIGSPVTEVAELVLYGSTNIRSTITGTIEPRTSQLCVVNSLFMAIISLDGDQVMESLKKTNKVVVDDWIK